MIVVMHRDRENWKGYKRRKKDTYWQTVRKEKQIEIEEPIVITSVIQNFRTRQQPELSTENYETSTSFLQNNHKRIERRHKFCKLRQSGNMK